MAHQSSKTMSMPSIFRLFILLAVSGLAGAVSFIEYYHQLPATVDFSAAKACYIVFGTISQVDSGNEANGYKCEYTTHLWTQDNEMALDYCTSRHPYHIIKAESKGNGQTTCAFQLNLKCKPDWYQINNMCYKVTPGKYSYENAKKSCSQLESAKEAEGQIAEYYSSGLSIYISEMMFTDAWVRVSHISEHFVNGQGDAAVFVLDGAFKYDAKPGSLVLDTLEAKHHALCQYKPNMEMSEVNYIAKQYNEIYPVMLTDSGPSIGSASYESIQQVDNSKARFEKFNTDTTRKVCENIGNILNVHSYPLVSIEDEYQIVRDHLTNHRFYLTSAYKNDGCKYSDYRDIDSETGTAVPVYRSGSSSTQVCNAFSLVFSKMRRHPAPAAFRAPVLCTLHSFSFGYAPCPAGWIQFERKGNTPFCHYVYKGAPVSYESARQACFAEGASLTGFESKEEFEFVQQNCEGPHRTQYPQTDHHYYLGGVIPCKVDCLPTDMASWDEGVSRNTRFLNEFSHAGHYWRNDKYFDIVAYRADFVAFHTHNRLDYFGEMFYICGKYPGFISKKRGAKGVKSG